MSASAEVAGVAEDESVLPSQCPFEKNVCPSAELANRRCYVLCIALLCRQGTHKWFFSCFVIEAVAMPNLKSFVPTHFVNKDQTNFAKFGSSKRK